MATFPPSPTRSSYSARAATNACCVSSLRSVAPPKLAFGGGFGRGALRACTTPRGTPLASLAEGDLGFLFLFSLLSLRDLLVGVSLPASSAGGAVDLRAARASDLNSISNGTVARVPFWARRAYTALAS